MLIIDARESDSLEKAGIMKELRRRQAFTKPSITNRTKTLKAIYRDQVLRNED